MYAYFLTGSLQNALEAKQAKGRDQVGRNLPRFKKPGRGLDTGRKIRQVDGVAGMLCKEHIRGSDREQVGNGRGNLWWSSYNRTER